MGYDDLEYFEMVCGGGMGARENMLFHTPVVTQGCRAITADKDLIFTKDQQMTKAIPNS